VAWAGPHSWRRAWPLAAVSGGAILVLYVLIPAGAGLDDTWRRLASGNGIWLGVAVCLEALSYACYMMLLRVVFRDRSASLGWAWSYRVTMAGVVASRLFALAGAGGIAVTAWALHRIGVRGRRLTERMAVFYVLLYGVYMAALVVGGLGLWLGVFSGPAPAGLTLLPALFGTTVILIALMAASFTSGLDETLDGLADGRANRWRTAIAAAPATLASGVAGALALVRSMPVAVLAGGGWFALDIAVLAASLAAYGEVPAVATVVMAYFVGMLANALPVPGGVGAVEGGMTAALIGFGVSPGLALVGVLTYRAFAFWLPMIPGAFAYLALLRTEPPATVGEDTSSGESVVGAE
jgi:uncharacterized membrane protein YbhN (UPF0104 family)